MYTSRLTGCIYVHECMRAFMHNKVDRQAFVCRRAGGQVGRYGYYPSFDSFL